MKKIALMFAALSLCACSLSACGGDDDDNSKKANGEVCTVADDCESGYCDAKDGKDGKCADKPADETKKENGADCTKADECKSNYCSEDKKCAAKPEEGDKKADNGAACEKADDCKSGFCSDDKKCADKPEEGDKKADNGAACEKADDCKSGFCGDDKKCADKPEEGDKKEDGADCTKDEECKGGICNDEKKCESVDLPECNKNEDCKDNSKAICDLKSNTCVECTTEDASACELATAVGPICVENACAKCTTDEQCGEGKACNKESGKCETAAECLDNSDCKDAAKPVCNENHVCVATAAKDPCKDVTCEKGTCDKGICVTDAMKAVKDGEAWPTDAKSDYCAGDNFVYKDGNKAYVVDCTKDGFTGCVVFSPDNGTTIAADCNSQKAALDACDASTKMKIDTCITSDLLYEVMCIEDLSGKAIAVPTYEGNNDQNCKKANKTCKIESDVPACK